jgi:ABC-type nitrate/sulfonate/bicarbonate transport system substrate-binding protein
MKAATPFKRSATPDAETPRLCRLLRHAALLVVTAATFLLPQGRPAAAETTVKLAMTISTTFIGTLAAIQKGYFDEEGIKIVPEWTSGPRLRDGLYTRQYDFIVGALQLVALARERGMPFKIVAPAYERDLFALFARKGLAGLDKVSSDLKGLLKGKRVGQTEVGSGSWMFAASVYKQAGLDPRTDMVSVNLGGNPQVFLVALKSGTVDLVSIWQPIISMVERDGLATRVGDVAGTKNSLTSAIVTREDVIKDNPDLVRRMVRANQRGADYARATPAAEIAQLVGPLLEGIDQALLARIIDEVRSGFPAGGLSVGAFDAGMRPLVDTEILKNAIPFDTLVDATFAGRRD